MKLKIKLSTIIKFSVVIFFLCGYNFFYLISFPGFTNNDFRYLCLLGIFTAAALYLGKGNSLIGTQTPGRGLNYYVILTIISLGCLTIFTVLTYPRQGFRFTFWMICNYLMVIWAYPIYFLMIRDKTEIKELDIVTFISLIWSVLVLFQSLFHMLTGNMLFSFLDGAYVGIRDDRIRMSIGPFVDFSVIYCFWVLYFKKYPKRKLYHLISLIILFLAVVMVQQSRATLIAIFVSVIAMILFDTNRGYRWIKKVGICIVLLLILTMTDYIQSFFTSMFTEYQVSVTARVYATDYFWSVFENNPIFGFGLLKSPEYNYIRNGSLGIASTDDVGIIGQFAYLGIFALIIVIGLYIYLIRLIWLVRKRTGEFNCLMVGAMAYLLFTSTTLIVFDQQRICLLPIIVALFEYYRSMVNDKKTRLI